MPRRRRHSSGSPRREERFTQEITIDGTIYLIDGENNPYSTETRKVGTQCDANEVVAAVNKKMILTISNLTN